MAMALLQKFDETKQQNDLQQAQEYVVIAQSRNPDSARVLLASGRVNKANHFYNRAVQDYRRMLELDPRNINALLGIAGVYEQLDEPQEVIDAVRKAQKLDPEYYRSYQLLGGILCRRRPFWRSGRAISQGHLARARVYRQLFQPRRNVDCIAAIC